jgi:hypothetical protein
MSHEEPARLEKLGEPGDIYIYIVIMRVVAIDDKKIDDIVKSSLSPQNQR